MEPVLDNDSRTPQPAPAALQNSADGAIAVRPQAEAAIASSTGSGYSNQGYTSRDEPEGFDMQRIWSIVLRRWKVMLAIFLAATVIGIFTLIRSKPIYQANAIIEISPPQQRNTGATVPGMERFMGGSGADMLATQIENLKNSEVSMRAMSKLTQEQRAAVAKFVNINVAQNGLTRNVTVSVQSYNPKAAAALANGICNEYIAMSLDSNRANSQGGVEYVKDQLAQVGERLSQAQAKLRDWKEKNKIVDITGETQAIATKAGELQKTLEEASAERAAMDARLGVIQGQLSKLPAGRVIPSGVQRNPAVTTLQAQLTALELDLANAKREYQPGSRKVRGIESQISNLRRQLQSEAKTIVDAWQPDPARAPLASEAASTQANLWSLDARIAALKGQDASARQNLARLPQKEMEVSRLANEVTTQQQTYDFLNNQLQVLSITASGASPDGYLRSKASPSDIPVAPNKTRVLIYTMMVGLLAALGMGLLLDLMDNHVYSEDDVYRATGLPVLVQVPLFREEQQFNLLQASQAVTGKSSPLLETFRMLRTNIQLSVVDKPVRSVVITSSMPSEGKSHTALNLAVAAATSGDKVVLVDLDLRRPSAHRICELSNEVGFTSVVSNQCTLDEALQETAVPGLRVLTSGPVPPNPFRLLNSKASRALIESLKAEADLVVIDTPPMLTMADALLISSWVDGTLLVISSSEMRKKDVSRSADMLYQNNGEVLGTILTKVSSNTDGYYSYYGYKNYNHYFESDEAVEFSGEKSLPANETVVKK